MHASVHALRCAKYETRATNCVPHMRLAILNPSHAKQCRAGMHLLQRFVRRRLGWHVALDTVQVSRPLPRSQRTRGFTAYTDAFRFTHQRCPYGRSSSRAMPHSIRVTGYDMIVRNQEQGNGRFFRQGVVPNGKF
jgi:hypothetical protein